MKYALTAGLAVMLGLAGITTGGGQTAMQPTPTTKILATGTINPGVASLDVRLLALSGPFG